jgi:hypothetical protein
MPPGHIEAMIRWAAINGHGPSPHPQHARRPSTSLDLEELKGLALLKQALRVDVCGLKLVRSRRPPGSAVVADDLQLVDLQMGHCGVPAALRVVVGAADDGHGGLENVLLDEV